MPRRPLLLATLIAACCFACNPGSTDSTLEEDPVMRIYDKYLYANDLGGIGEGHPRKDSIEMVEIFIRNWAKRTLMLKEAESVILDELLEIDKQIEDYRTSLVVYAYEKALVKRQMDTVVSRSEVQRYYDEYIENFTLSDDLYKFHYAWIGNENPGVNAIEQVMAKTGETTSAQLAAMCEQFSARDFSAADNRWYQKARILSQFPISEANLISMSQNNNLVRLDQKDEVLFMRVIDMVGKGTAAPLEHVEADIQKIILNKRRVDLLDNYYKRIYERDMNSKNVERF